MSKLFRIACLLAMVAAPLGAQAATPVAAAPLGAQAATPVAVAPLGARAATPAAATPAKPAAAAPATATPAIAITPVKIDINAAPAAQLDTLPGIGPARAKAIIDNRPYADLSDLVGKKVLTQAVFDGAKSRMALANINTSSAADLAKTLPGIGDARAKAIVTGRPYATPQDLVAKGVLTQALFDKIKDLVAL